MLRVRTFCGDGDLSLLVVLSLFEREKFTLSDILTAGRLVKPLNLASFEAKTLFHTKRVFRKEQRTGSRIAKDGGERHMGRAECVERLYSPTLHVCK